MTIKPHRLKTILPLVAGAMFASASVSNAAPVVYDLTVSFPAGFGGDITLDIDDATDDGSEVTYELGNGSIVDYFINQPATPSASDGGFSPADPLNEFSRLIITFDNGGTVGDHTDDTPLELDVDFDDSVNGSLFGVLNFTTGLGGIDTQPGGQTGAALTAVAEPASAFAITEIDHDADANTVTLTWNSSPTETFTVRYSGDMTNWESDLGDDIEADDGETTTKTFDLEDAGVAEAGRLHFRVEK